MVNFIVPLLNLTREGNLNVEHAMATSYRSRINYAIMEPYKDYEVILVGRVARVEADNGIVVLTASDDKEVPVCLTF
jgi:hypothetical protein